MRRLTYPGPGRPDCYPKKAAVLSTPAIKLAERVEHYRSGHQARAAAFWRSSNFLSEGMVQPLTALLARTEVLIDLLDTGDVVDVPRQLVSMQKSAQRLAGRAEALAAASATHASTSRG